MNLQSVRIYGFGKYQDFSLEFTPGLNVIEGRNEAGKSTLFSFVKAILFGFESRRLPEARFEPLEGGKFGGSVSVRDSSGQTFLIERTGQRKSQGTVRILMPDGTERGEEFLPRLLDGMAPTFYTSIYAFGLDELAYLTSLGHEEVSHYLFNSGTGISLQQMQRNWLEETDKLFKPRGNQPLINQKLNKLEELDLEIRQLQKENESYNELLKHKEELDQQIAILQNKLKRIRQDQLRWEKTKEIYPVWSEIQSYLQKLKQLPDFPSFPVQGVSRLEVLEEQIRELEAEVGAYQRKIEQGLHASSQIIVEKDLLALGEEIVSLEKQASRWLEKKDQLAHLLSEYRQKQSEVQRDLAQLGNGWDESRLEQCDVSLSRKEVIREHRQMFQELTASLQSLDELLLVKEEEARELKKEHQRLQEELAGHSVPSIEQWEQMFTRMQQVSHALEAERNQQAWVSRQYEEELSQKKRGMSKPDSTDPWRIMIILFGTLGLVMSGWQYVQNEWSWSILFPVILGVALSIWAWMRGVQSRKALTASHASEHLQSLKQKLLELEQSIQQKNDQLKTWGEKWFNGETDLNLLLPSIQRLRKQREVYVKKQERLEWTGDRWDQLLKEIETVENRKKSFDRKRDDRVAQWNQLLTEFGLTPGLSPDGALELIAVAANGKENVRKQMTLKDRCVSLEQDLTTFSSQVEELANRAKIDIDTEDPWNLLFLIKKKWEESSHNREKRKSLEDRIASLQEEKEDKHQLLSKLLEERNHLFSLAGVSDSEMFRNASVQYTEKQRLEEKIQMLRDTMDTTIPEEQFAIIASTYRLEQVVVELEYTHEQILQTEKELQELLDRRGQWKNKLAQLESGVNLSTLHQLRQELLTEVEEAAKRWTLYRMASLVLDKTIESYEAKKQPGVLLAASRFFHLMTNGRYARILSPIGEQRLVVEREDGKRLEPGYLSRGTREQLFLSLRFALIQESKKTESLPILLDDIYVNFDQSRTLQAISTLEEMKKDHQILFFTCHERIGSIIKEQVSGTNLIQLNSVSAAV